jgi:hypothetical protein
MRIAPQRERHHLFLLHEAGRWRTRGGKPPRRAEVAIRQPQGLPSGSPRHFQRLNLISDQLPMYKHDIAQ